MDDIAIAFPPELPKRQAVICVRQPTQSQVMTNLESQLRQYELAKKARRSGFSGIDVIDDDFGVSASGCQARPGFEPLVAMLCSASVGAVFCLGMSPLARNGRGWHHMLELCGLVDACVMNHDGVYDTRHPNDRLLLGKKGSISDFELGTLSPMHVSGIGKALLSRLGEEQLARYFRTCRQDRFTDKTITTPDGLRAELAQIRAQGYSFDDEERTGGMRCVAAPIINLYGEAVAGISVSGPTNRMGSDRIAEIGELVRVAASTISRGLGAPDA